MVIASSSYKIPVVVSLATVSAGVFNWSHRELTFAPVLDTALLRLIFIPPATNTVKLINRGRGAERRTERHS